MNDAEQFLKQLFKTHGISVAEGRNEIFASFLQDKQNSNIIHSMMLQQDALMKKWKLQERIAEIVQQPVRIPNATAGKPYEARLDFDKLNWKDIVDYDFDGLEAVGLRFDKEKGLVTGVPSQSGDQKLLLKFKVEGQLPEEALNEKQIPLIVNPDPRSLWKNIDSNRGDQYWKEDNVTVFAPLGDRHILVSSKRGRSHANVGSFREDDFAFSELDNSWSLVVVADGAGSAKASRKGSALACNVVVEYFQQKDSFEQLGEMDELVSQAQVGNTEEAQKKIKLSVYNSLGKAAIHVHKTLHRLAQQEGLALKDLSSTLIFTLYKKYEAGYAFLSFGVGDCPIAVLNREMTEVHLMNWLDVGEFGGGTRFITMPEIFQNEKFHTRFGFKLLEDFSYLVMMSDGIYDPKFVVESALPKIENWQSFFADLSGDNEEKIKVELSASNKEIENQFSRWMDFWSQGNHDDRTLAIVF